MKRDLYEISEIDEKINNKLEYVRCNPEATPKDINEVKVLKNDIYNKTSQVFIYNLKKLIQLELTQKNLARKIGLSEDLLSKYKSGEAFPSIETLIYISKIYNISMDKLIGTPLTSEDIEKLENNQAIEFKIFEEKYYVYFFVTNIAKEGTIHEGVLEVQNSNAVFRILSNGDIVKAFTGTYTIFDKLIYFNLHNSEEGIAFISMLKPNVNKNKYVGGLAMLMLPSDANSKPCTQKILFSKIRINRELHYGKLKELLDFCNEGNSFGHVKLSQWDDEGAYNFIRKLL